VRRCFGLMGGSPEETEGRTDQKWEPPILCFWPFFSYFDPQADLEGERRGRKSRGQPRKESEGPITVAGLVKILSAPPQNLLIHFPSSTIWDCSGLILTGARMRSIDWLTWPPFTLMELTGGCHEVKVDEWFPVIDLNLFGFGIAKTDRLYLSLRLVASDKFGGMATKPSC
jgi:hypothetical protein